MRTLFRWYYLVSGFFLLDTMQAFGFMSRMVYGSWAGKAGDPITQTLNLLMIAASLTLFGISYRRSKKGFAVGSVLALSAVGFLCLSALWSLDPPTTVRVAIVYLFVILGAIGIARTMDADEYMHLLSWCCFLSAIASILLLVASPSNALMAVYRRDGIRDARFHRDISSEECPGAGHGDRSACHPARHQGRPTAVSGQALYVVRVRGNGLRVQVHGRVDGRVAFLRHQRIRQSMAEGRRGAHDRRHLGGLSCADAHRCRGCARHVSGTDRQGSDPDRANRDMGLCHPGHLDEAVAGMGLLRFLGTDQSSTPPKFPMPCVGSVPNAHNGLLEFLLDVGVLGTALFAFILIRTIVLAVRCLRTPERALAISTISCCAGILLVGVSETVLLNPTQSSTPVMFITGLMCERALYVAKGLRRYRVAVSRGQIGRSLSGSRGLALGA